MNSILCPVDFSEASLNGLEYTAQLAKTLSANITLIHVQASIAPEAQPLKPTDETNTSNTSLRLQEICKETQQEFGIQCNHCLKTSTDSLREIIADEATHYDLVVMGSDGANNFYQYLFGSNAFRMIEKIKQPVLIVPAGCTFKPIQRIVYAYDPNTNPIFLIDQLKALVVPAKSGVSVLHVSKDKISAETEHKLKILREAVMARALRNTDWTFDFVYSKDVSWSLDQYVKKHEVDILALSFHHRTLMEKILSENVIKNITMISTYPTLVFWH